MPSGRTNNSPESGCGLGHNFGSTVGYPSDSLASCLLWQVQVSAIDTHRQFQLYIEIRSFQIILLVQQLSLSLIGFQC